MSGLPDRASVMCITSAEDLRQSIEQVSQSPHLFVGARSPVHIQQRCEERLEVDLQRYFE